MESWNQVIHLLQVAPCHSSEKFIICSSAPFLEFKLMKLFPFVNMHKLQ